ncbi:hypothetical protein IBX73_07370 [candidate division WOR-3 bacterium]|nr:hypothetical protein [candidate division WOR-3 bacterium]
MKVMFCIIMGVVMNTLSWGSTFVISNADESQEFTSIAYDGTHYFVVWHDLRNGNYDIYGSRVSQDAIVMDPDGIPISTNLAAARNPAIAFDGDNYLIVWRDNRNSSTKSDIYGARVSRSGQIIDPDGFAVSDSYHHQLQPALAFGENCYLVAWEDTRDKAMQTSMAEE